MATRKKSMKGEASQARAAQAAAQVAAQDRPVQGRAMGAVVEVKAGDVPVGDPGPARSLQTRLQGSFAPAPALGKWSGRRTTVLLVLFGVVGWLMVGALAWALVLLLG